MRPSVSVDVSHVDFVIRVDANGRIAAPGAVRHGAINPGQPIVDRNRHPLAASSARGARRIWDVNRAVGSNLDVTVNPSVALSRGENIYAGAKRQTAVVAARALRTANDVL